jgi:hypothetical protein
MAYLCDVGELRNLIIFTIMVIVNYLALVFWYPISLAIKIVFMDTIFSLRNSDHTLQDASFYLITFVIENVTKAFKAAYEQLYPFTLVIVVQFFLVSDKPSIGNFALYTTQAVPSVLRFLLSIVFIGSFLLRPLVMRPISFVWARIIESEKPVFTLIFGGAPTFATAIGEAAKHL